MSRVSVILTFKRVRNRILGELAQENPMFRNIVVIRFRTTLIDNFADMRHFADDDAFGQVRCLPVLQSLGF